MPDVSTAAATAAASGSLLADASRNNALLTFCSAIGVALIAFVPSRLSARAAARTADMAQRKQAADEEKAHRDELRAERDDARKERDALRLQLDECKESRLALERALMLREAACERGGRLCQPPPEPPKSAPATTSPQESRKP